MPASKNSEFQRSYKIINELSILIITGSYKRTRLFFIKEVYENF